MSPLQHYETFLIHNSSTIATIGVFFIKYIGLNPKHSYLLESSLRSLTWFLPGRFKDAELASEARSSY